MTGISNAFICIPDNIRFRDKYFCDNIDPHCHHSSYAISGQETILFDLQHIK